MLKRLRWQLTGLYVLAAVALIFLIGGSAYGLLTYYFQSANDLALQYKVAQAYISAGIPVPPDLQSANAIWQTRNPVTTKTPFPPSETEHESEYEESVDGEYHNDRQTPLPQQVNTDEDESYDSELAAIYLLPVDDKGQLLDNPNAYVPPINPNIQSIEAAIANGSDFRTIWENGERVRLFSYRVNKGDEFSLYQTPTVLQVGRSLKDQDRILTQLLVSMAILGGIGVVSVGLGSWWLAGRSVRPAQQAWDRQQAFVANASHELRTPLTVLRASAEVAQRGMDKSDKHFTLISDILQETDYMSHLVDDLLLLSRLDAGRLKLEQQPIDVSELLNELTRQMGHVAEGSDITLEIEPPSNSAPRSTTIADPTRLRQVLLILLDNALHHTPSGGLIRLRTQSDGRYTQLTVSDSGSGIDPQHLPHVFERFYRGKEDRSQHDSGSGLGLAIARGLVEAMHGQIEITSQLDRGTQVIIRLPAK